MAITMKDLNDRISTLEGKAATTPITMKNLSDRVANLEATAKKWEIVTINPTSNQYLIPEAYRGWSWIIFNVSQSLTNKLSNAGKATCGLTNGKSLIHWVEPTGIGYRGFTLTFSQSGNYIVPSIVSYGGLGAIKIMFYK